LFQINELLGLDLFEGDIIIDDRKTLSSHRNAIKDLSWPWHDGVLPISVEPEVSMNVIGSLHQAIRELEARSVISFRAADETIEDWIKIIHDGGCGSATGRRGGEQILSLSDGCNLMKTIIHEFLHALGIKHTQVIYHFFYFDSDFEN
jgi:tetrahydromethanopterin S-methyltransferase subunit H